MELENTYIIKLVKPYHSNLRSELFKTPKIYFYDSGLLQMLQLKTIPRAIMGKVFETAVFSELVKRCGKDRIFDWRTKDKKEIDFILRQKDTILPVEVKYFFSIFKNSNSLLLNKISSQRLQGNRIWERFESGTVYVFVGRNFVISQ